MNELVLGRRALLRAAAISGAGFGLAQALPAWAQPLSKGLVRPLPTVSGNEIALTIGQVSVEVDGKVSRAIGINGTVPGPLIRLKEGQRVRLRVQNTLDEDSSIHWHGLLVPFEMDGVPGVSFPGIMPRSTFDYEFDLSHAGTYWYHSHSAYQEEDGVYGPIVIDPAGPDPVAYDREHVLVLSDHSPLAGATIYRKLKQMGGPYFNRQRMTLSGLLAGRDLTAKERWEWAQMRMDAADIADVTGSTYAFTINGFGPFDNWTGLFTPGERVRLRIINASAQTTFNIRIPGLPMTVVQADGLNVRPVAVDEFQIGTAETYDVVVTPGDRAYSFVSEASDRSGLGRATLAPREGMSAPVPPLRPRPLLTMKDMGMGDMDHSGMNHGAMGSGSSNPAKVRGVDPTAQQNASGELWKLTGWKETGAVVATAAAAGMAGMDHAAMGHGSVAASPAAAPMDHAAMGHTAPAAAGQAAAPMDHGSMGMRDFANAPEVDKNPGVQTISPMPVDRMGDPGTGLEDVGHRVLNYRDLMALERNPDVRAPSRQLDIHLTGNMERYMWSFDGVKMSEPAEPIPFRHNERVRVRLVNDTMMQHPIHLHGHFFELVTGHGAWSPRKHTVNVQPGGTATFDVTLDAQGDWAFHCHNLYHMTAGMMRVVTVRPDKGDA
ncbi:copper resistance system multicopper oxidase [Altererythrobacter sp. H2]|uniref:copper resistance system multicopper oxidase n=1 Tax=Altererythrobacter sp. H2 TaxID=3108391 RepID=UPI002B4BA659|nr:copper resistance system multicopper oxidase [Altererythrobacter sp. H2]WRK96499.1 copper resistance system multicopper oxidase [Altererythrobacter sp. H2]